MLYTYYIFLLLNIGNVTSAYTMRLHSLIQTPYTSWERRKAAAATVWHDADDDVEALWLLAKRNFFLVSVRFAVDFYDDIYSKI